MKETTGTVWPPLETAYTDEFGQIDPEVYKAAGALWGKAEKYALSALSDAPTGLRLMLKAVAIVSRKRAAQAAHIENLTAYLFQTYKHLILAELEKESGHRRRETEMRAETASSYGAVAEDIDRKILVEQIIRRMDDWMREVFELLTLGHSFEEIGQMRGEKGHTIRTKFNKRLKRLMEQLSAAW